MYNVENDVDRKVTNIDLRNHWENVTIDGCKLINTTYGSAGGSIWIRAGEGETRNLVIKNNYIMKSCHDETIAIFGKGEVSNVTIVNNEIIHDDTNVEIKSNPIINLGINVGGNTTSIKNVVFDNNNIKIIADGDFMIFTNSDDITVKNCNFDITSLSEKEYVRYFASYGNTSNINFEGNKIKLTGECSTAEIFYDIDSVKNNTIDVNTEFITFAQNCYEFTQNKINFNKDLIEVSSSIFRIKNKAVDKNILFSGNDLTFNTELTVSTRLINLFSSYLNNYRFEISNNNITGIDGQNTNMQYAIFFQSMKDTVPQTVYMLNNNLGFYSNNIERYDNLTDYNINN